jgi:hypothetical protein
MPYAEVTTTTLWQRTAASMFSKRAKKYGDVRMLGPQEVESLAKEHSYPISNPEDGFNETTLLKYLCMIDFLRSGYEEFLWLDLDVFITLANKDLFYCTPGTITLPANRWSPGGKPRNKWYNVRARAYRKTCELLNKQPDKNPIIPSNWYMCFDRSAIEQFEWYLELLPDMVPIIKCDDEAFTPFIVNNIIEATNLRDVTTDYEVINDDNTHHLDDIDFCRLKMLHLSYAHKDRYMWIAEEEISSQIARNHPRT